MSTYIGDDEFLDVVYNDGVKIGETEPTRDTKFLYYEVYLYNGSLYACVMDSGSIVCGEQISIDELSLYVDSLDCTLDFLFELTPEFVHHKFIKS